MAVYRISSRTEVPIFAQRMRTLFEGRVLRLIPLILLALAYGLANAQDAPAADAASAREADIARIIDGIISFTQWPAASGKVRLCLTTPVIHADALEAELSGSKQLADVQDLAPDDFRLDSDCDVVYIEQVDDANRAHLFQRLVGRPVLTIAGVASGCLMGSLFCLSGTGVPATFSANLDTIARSGLRINPKVLFLARPHQAK